MILYNGASGGLGQYLGTLLGGLEEPSHAIIARLEDHSGLDSELRHLDPFGAVTLIHLAARVSVPACESDPIGAYTTNVDMARALVVAVIAWAMQRGATIRVIYVSTGHVYASQPHGSRLSEEAPTLPRSVYARTKLAAEEALTAVAIANGVPFAVARVFGLLAPRQAPNYVLPALIARAGTGSLDNIPGLDFTRDYLDARDVCADLLRLAAAHWPDGPLVVNVCSGVPVTIRELLRTVLVELFPQGDDDLARSASAAPGRLDDVPWLVGNPTRFARVTGSAPQRIPLSRTIADAVAFGNDQARSSS